MQGRAERKQPDFILLHPMWGIIVLEVKDWAKILEANPYQVIVKTKKEPTGSFMKRPVSFSDLSRAAVMFEQARNLGHSLDYLLYGIIGL